MKRSFEEWKQMVGTQIGDYEIASSILANWEEERFRLKRDIDDMNNSQCSQFTRCNDCGRLHDEGWICPHCGYDGG